VVVEQLWRLSLDRLVAVCLRPMHLHDLAVHLEPVHLLYRLQRGLFAVEDNERLALALQAALRDNIENRTVVLEDSSQGLLHGIDLNALLEVVDLVLSAIAPPSAMRVRCWRPHLQLT
jgi:hypothetical protein